MYGNPVLWKIQKQGNVIKSPTHAEYVALSEADTDIIYLLGVCKQIAPSAVRIYVDNLGTVCIANLGNFT